MPEEKRKFSFLVVGLAKNCGRTVAKDVFKIKNALSIAESIHWLIIESDSDDNTGSQLNLLSQSVSNFDFKSLGSLSHQYPDRTARLAYCRNFYLDIVNNSPEYVNVDYVLMADFDGINTDLSSDGVESCFARSDWDACFANQRGPYYDIWALRHEFWNPGDCWQNLRFLNTVQKNRRKNLNAAIHSKMLVIPPGSPWIQVDSAFGGLGIYRKTVLRDGRYSGVSAAGYPQSEHVTFHRELIKKGHSLFINPSLINARFTEHSYGSTIIGKLMLAPHATRIFGAKLADELRKNLRRYITNQRHRAELP